MNLYGMDPAQNPKTPAFVICNDVNDKEHAYEETKGQINLEGAFTDIQISHLFCYLLLQR